MVRQLAIFIMFLPNQSHPGSVCLVKKFIQILRQESLVFFPRSMTPRPLIFWLTNQLPGSFGHSIGVDARAPLQAVFFELINLLDDTLRQLKSTHEEGGQG